MVGAGVSGLAAAARLRELGLQVRVLEKSRGLGGRSATRRIGRLAFDHGAQYFTVREPEFEEALAPHLRRGAVVPWEPRVLRLANDGALSPVREVARFVGVPGMSMLGRSLKGDTVVTPGTHVSTMAASVGGSWNLIGERGDDYGPFSGIILTCPAPQAAHLLSESAPDLAEICRDVEMLPCWATMVAFDRPLGLDFDAAFVDDELLAWAANESTKPGRRPRPECWTLHAAPEWSRERLYDEPDLVAREMVLRFLALSGAGSEEPTMRMAHRWRFARPAEPRTPGNLLDRDRRVGVAGDWTRGDRVEAAFMSGIGMADRLACLFSGPYSPAP